MFPSDRKPLTYTDADTANASVASLLCLLPATLLAWPPRLVLEVSDDKFRRYLVYLKYWTLNLGSLMVYPKVLFPPNLINLLQELLEAAAKQEPGLLAALKGPIAAYLTEATQAGGLLAMGDEGTGVKLGSSLVQQAELLAGLTAVAELQLPQQHALIPGSVKRDLPDRLAKADLLGFRVLKPIPLVSSEGRGPLCRDAI